MAPRGFEVSFYDFGNIFFISYNSRVLIKSKSIAKWYWKIKRFKRGY